MSNDSGFYIKSMLFGDGQGNNMATMILTMIVVVSAMMMMVMVMVMVTTAMTVTILGMMAIETLTMTCATRLTSL